MKCVSETLATHIWNCIKDDKELKKIIRSQEQISYQSPKDAQAKPAKSTQLSIFLYNITENTNMRNQPQPQNPTAPRTLLYLNLHYLITPLTEKAETDQVLLGKIIQLFAEAPVLRGSTLQGSLGEEAGELRVVLDVFSLDDLSKLSTLLSSPYRLSVGYTVSPVRIVASNIPEQKPVIVQKPQVKPEKAKEKKLQ